MDKGTLEYIKEHQEFIKESIDKIFKNPTKKNWKGADVQIAFNEKFFFTTDNWNDRRINLFRGFFSGLMHNGIHNEIIFIGDLEIIHQWNDDENYVFIRDIKRNNLYYATWYKSRGRTDLILKNGKPINLTAFKVLLMKMTQPVSVKYLGIDV